MLHKLLCDGSIFEVVFDYGSSGETLSKNTLALTVFLHNRD